MNTTSTFHVFRDHAIRALHRGDPNALGLVAMVLYDLYAVQDAVAPFWWGLRGPEGGLAPRVFVFHRETHACFSRKRPSPFDLVADVARALAAVPPEAAAEILSHPGPRPGWRDE